MPFFSCPLPASFSAPPAPSYGVYRPPQLFSVFPSFSRLQPIVPPVPISFALPPFVFGVLFPASCVLFLPAFSFPVILLSRLSIRSIPVALSLAPLSPSTNTSSSCLSAPLRIGGGESTEKGIIRRPAKWAARSSLSSPHRLGSLCICSLLASGISRIAQPSIISSGFCAIGAQCIWLAEQDPGHTPQISHSNWLLQWLVRMFSVIKLLHVLYTSLARAVSSLYTH